MNLLLVIHSLSCGGAERVLSTLANAWAEQGHKLSIATMDDSAPFYPLVPAVQLFSLNVASESGGGMTSIAANIRRISALRRCIRLVNPDLIISFMTQTNVIAIMAAQEGGVPVVVCEHTDPRHQQMGLTWSALRVAIYPFADAVTFLTSNVLQRWTLWLAGKAQLVPNPVSVEPTAHPVMLNYSLNLIAAGRLIELKGFDLLIEAFSAIASSHQDWGLTILGEGALREQLEQQAKEAGLSGRICLPGRVANPHAWFSKADLFVLSSRYEGLPCALCEAMACGTPAVSFDCESGPADIIGHGINGMLVPPNNVRALADALDRLMSDNQERERLALRASEVQLRFGLPQILERWDRLFDSLGVEV